MEARGLQHQLWNIRDVTAQLQPQTWAGEKDRHTVRALLALRLAKEAFVTGGGPQEAEGAAGGRPPLLVPTASDTSGHEWNAICPVGGRDKEQSAQCT